MSLSDQQFLQHAIRIGARGLGRTWPNPSVGCVLVKDGAVIAAAHTAESGRPHAETQALELASGDARGATAYVTLEPCSHHGLTPPCAQALINAKIARVVIGCMDQDPRVAGQGLAILTAAGIAVEKILLPEAARAHRGFFRRINHGLPLVYAKVASSLDGIMSDAKGESQWITGAIARQHGHQLRAQVDAIITGIGTVLKDDPQLTVRIPGNSHDRLARVVCDRNLRLPRDCKLVKTAEQQATWLITTPEAIEQNASHASDLRERGVTFLVVEDAKLTPMNILKTLANHGITRTLLEAGPKLTTAFLAAKVVDELYWYRAPILLGNTGASAISALDSSLANAAAARPIRSIMLGPDRCDIYELDSCLPD